MNLRGLATFLCFSSLLCAADQWKDKKPSDWTSKDAARLLANSPWAKKASVEMDFSRTGGGPGGMGGPGGGPPGGEGPPGGDMGGPGEMPQPEIIVRWESAAPVRAADARVEDANASKIAALAQDFYVISITGGPMILGGRPPQEGQNRSQPDFGRIERRLLQTASLHLKGQEVIAPDKVEVLEDAEGIKTLLLFPRSREIRAEDKEVTLVLTLGPMQVKARFVLKDMVYDANLAL